RDTIKRKANEFITMKRAEWSSQIAERDKSIADLTQRLAQAEAAAFRSQELERQLAAANDRLRCLESQSGEEHHQPWAGLGLASAAAGMAAAAVTAADAAATADTTAAAHASQQQQQQ
ncbi:unnamed protein product, partial [Polarella glacialis]